MFACHESLQSRLAETLRSRVEGSGGFFLNGKFDSLERPESSYPLVRAFEDFVQDLLQRPTAQYAHVHAALKEFTASDYLLTDMIPALRHFQGNPTTRRIRTSGMKGKLRTELAFCRLVRAIASPDTPVVLFVDDLQWAKPAPLDIMVALVTDPCINGFLFLGACRGDEVDLSHYLSVALRDLEESKDGIVTDIQLRNLDEATVQSMVNDTFGYNHPNLAKLVWKQSAGNIFFTVQIIRAILDQKDSLQKADTGGLLQHVFGHESAVDLLTELIRGMPKDVRDVLTIASCFGAEFHPALLEDLVVCDIQVPLAICQDRQLVCQGHGGTMRFTHDQVQHSAYSLILKAKRKATHLELGRRLWESLSEEELKVHGFAVVRQLRLGASLIEDQDERYRMADLLLRAGKHAIEAASFEEASSHFALGLSLLGPRHWRDEYILSLDLHNEAASVAYCNGDYKRVKELTDPIIDNARINEHKIRAYILQMDTFAARAEIDKSTLVGFEALTQVNYALPKKARLFHVLLELVKTKRLLRRVSDEEIKQLPRILEDSQEAAVVNLLLMLHPHTYVSTPLYAAIIPMRAVRIILMNGLCNTAPLALAALAVILTGSGEFELGLRLAELSMDLLHQLCTYEWQTRVVLLTHSFVFSIHRPIQDVLQPMKTAYVVGLTGQDISMAMVTASMRAGLALTASAPLKPFISDMRGSLCVMIRQQGDLSLGVLYLLPSFQFALNMVHPSENPAELTGEIMNEATFRAKYAENQFCMSIVSYYKLMLACYSNDFKFGETEANAALEGITVLPLAMQVSLLLYSGIAYASISSNRNRRHLRLVKKMLRRLKRFNVFAEHRICAQVNLLEAEVAVLKGCSDEAMKKFELSIACALNEGLTNLVGLANERAFYFQTAYGLENAQESLLPAVWAYKKWGAEAKVAKLVPILSSPSRTQFEQQLKSTEPEAATSSTPKMSCGC